MKVVEEEARRLVLEDGLMKPGPLHLSMALLAFGMLTGYGAYSVGLVPGSAPYENVQYAGRLTWLPLLICSGIGALLLVGALAHTFTRVVLNKVDRTLIVERRGYFGAEVSHREPLEAVRCARVDDQGDTRRLELEMRSGSTIAPNGVYTNHYSPSVLSEAAHQINRFLASAPALRDEQIMNEPQS